MGLGHSLLFDAGRNDGRKEEQPRPSSSLSKRPVNTSVDKCDGAESASYHRPKKLRSFRRRSLSHSGLDGGYASDSALLRRFRKRNERPVVWESSSSLPAGPSLPKNVTEYASQQHSDVRPLQQSESVLSLLTNQSITSSCRHLLSQESQSLARATPTRPTAVDILICQDFEATGHGEISCEQGQHVVGLFRKGDWVFVQARNGVDGYVPFQYCCLNRHFYQGKCTSEFCAMSDTMPVRPVTSGHSSSAAGMRFRRRSNVTGFLSPCASVPEVFPPSENVGRRNLSFQTRPIAGLYQSRQNTNNTREGDTTSNKAASLSDYQGPSPFARAKSVRIASPRRSPRKQFGRDTVSDSEVARSAAVRAAFEPQLRKRGPTPPTRPNYLSRCITVRDHVGSREEELSVSFGDVAFIVEPRIDEWASVCLHDGSKGMVPKSCLAVEDCSKPEIKYSGE